MFKIIELLHYENFAMNYEQFIRLKRFQIVRNK